MFVGLNDPPDAKGLRWIEFGPNLVLREIIIGAQDAVKACGHSVTFSWAGMRQDAFLLVKQDHPPHWHASVK